MEDITTPSAAPPSIGTADAFLSATSGANEIKDDRAYDKDEHGTYHVIDHKPLPTRVTRLLFFCF